jgi:thioredoxin-like negative regulator of GroEL
MRFHPLLLLLVLAAAEAPAEAPPEVFAAALAQAQERRAPVLVDFHAPWCYSCYYMEKNVHTGAEWERARRELVMLDLDADSPDGARAMSAWSVKAMPTYIVFGADGQELGRVLGEQTRGEFYHWLFTTAGRASSLDALKASVVDGKEASVLAAREVLRAYHARYDASGGLGWFLTLPPPARGGIARDAQAASWIARLELQRAVAEKDVPGCVNVAGMVLAANLGCERPYELAKVMACAAGLPEAQRRELLRPQVEFMQLLVDKRVLSDYRCADERSIVTAAADLYQALGDAPAEALVLERAVADLKVRIGGDLRKDRSLVDNLRVYLERAGKQDELDALLVKLIEAYPEDYVYAYRYAKNLAARGKHAEALPFYEQAAAKTYGVNKLRIAELRAKSLQALSRTAEARQVLADALRDNGPWFPEDAAKLKALMAELPQA